MKKIFGLLLAASACVWAFSEGEDYTVLDKPMDEANGTVTKIFCFDCPACYRYDTDVVPALAQKLPNVKFQSRHLRRAGKDGSGSPDIIYKQASELFAVLSLQDADKNVTDANQSAYKKAQMAFYKAYHDDKTRWDDNGTGFLEIGLKAVDMNQSAYDEARKDDRVKSMMAANPDVFAIAKKHGTIPAFVVNGKYLINLSKIQSMDDFVAIIEELSKK